MNKTYKVNALETKPISVEITSDNAKYLTIKYMLDNPSNLENVFKEVFTQRYYSRYSIDFQELIYKGNFYDQSHFIHDFKEITGESPSFFFKRDLKNLKIFSGYEK